MNEREWKTTIIATSQKDAGPQACDVVLKRGSHVIERINQVPRPVARMLARRNRKRLGTWTIDWTAPRDQRIQSP